jgi:ADP-glucose pyrophosphorylase
MIRPVKNLDDTTCEKATSTTPQRKFNPMNEPPEIEYRVADIRENETKRLSNLVIIGVFLFLKNSLIDALRKETMEM